MKRYLVWGGSFLLTAIVAFALLYEKRQSEIMPVPGDTIIVDEEEGSYLEKEKWIEAMHLTAPGVDWKQIDQENKEILRQSRTAQRSLKSGSNKVDIADGRLMGEWNEKGSHNLAGRMRCIDVDFENGHIYGASDGGQIWKGNLQGKNWVSLSDYNHVKGLVFVRALKKQDGVVRVMMANNNSSLSSSKIFQYSDDDGQNWIGAEGLRGFNGRNFIRAITRPDGTIYLLMNRSGRSYIFKSDNLGTEFTEIDQMRTSSIVDLWTPRFDMDSVYLIDRSKLYVLNDEDQFNEKGTVSINFTEDNIEKIQLNGCISEGKTYLYVMLRLENNTKFYSSENGGLNWVEKEQLHGKPFMTNSFGVSTINPLLMGFGEVNAYRSIDGAASWQVINTWVEYYSNMATKLHADIPEIEFIRKPDGSELCFISTDGGTYMSDNGLDGVNNISLEDLNVSQYYSTYTHRVNTDIIYAGSQDQGFQRAVETTDGVSTFEQTHSGDYGHIVSSDGGKSLWTVYPGFAMRYTNAAGSNNIVSWDFTNDNHLWLPPLMADPYYPERVYLAGGTSSTGNHLWYLDQRSAVIDVVELPYDFSAGTDAWISSMAFSTINKDYRYVLNSFGKFFYSSDKGTSWGKSSNRGPDSHYFYGNTIIPDVNDINIIYLGGSGYSGHSAWVSHDGGHSFDPMANGLPNTLIFEMAINEDGTLLFAATEVGPFVWIKSEESWFDLSGGVAPEQTYWSVDYVTPLRTARFGTYGRGIWDFKINEYTGINEIFAHKESMGLSLYPNPVSDIANIEVVLPQAGDLNIRIINGAGQIVMEKTEKGLVQGSYTQSFDVGSLVKGIYYVQTISGKRINVGKLIRQ